MKPHPIIRERHINQDIYDDLCKQDVPVWLANILARKLTIPIPYELLINPVLSTIANPSIIPDMDKAVERTVSAITHGEDIAFCCDHDGDGTASSSVLWMAFVHYFGVSPERLQVVTSHRLTEGYGVTEPVANRLISAKATLIITADKGSSDEAQICRIAATGKDVIVTDHHLVPDAGHPKSAYAVVNPARSDSAYDRYICGAGVAFLFVCKVRSALLEAGFLKDSPSLTGLLDFVAVGTISDCVALTPSLSPANRAFIRYGLHLINQSNYRPCWEVFKADCGGQIKSEDVGFRLAPPIAAAGRLDWAEVGFKFLTSSTIEEAKENWQILQKENLLRRGIEKEITAKAIAAAKTMDHRQSIVIFDAEGHSGVHGISASRVVEAYGKPCGIFAPKGAGARKNSSFVPVNTEGYASGSFRGIAGVNLKMALEKIRTEHPELDLTGGGHAAAAGASLPVENIERFSELFESVIREQIGNDPLRPVIYVDGSLDEALINLSTVNLLNAMEPWGRDFSYPSHIGKFKIIDCHSMGNGTHLRLSMQYGNTLCRGVWFNAIDAGDPLPLKIGGIEELVFQLKINEYKGSKNLQLQILAKV